MRALDQPIHLEPVGSHHAPEVQKLVTSHPDIVGMTRMPDPYPEDGAATWIAQALPLHEAGEMFVFAIVRGDGQLVGMIGLMGAAGAGRSDEVGSHEGGAEMGYWIGGSYWNRGYATEAVGQLLEFAFHELDVERIFATPLERNVASHRVLQKNEFHLVRTFQNTEPKWKPTDRLVEYELTRTQWAADREKGGSTRASPR